MSSEHLAPASWHGPAGASGVSTVPAGRWRTHAGAPLAFALLVMLVLALQFGPLIGLLGFRLTGSMAWTLIGGARDLLVLSLVALAAASLLASTRAIRLDGSAAWALVLATAYAGFAFMSSEHPLLVALNLRRLALVPLLYVALLLLPWNRRQLEALVAVLLTSSVVVVAWGLLERFAPTALWTELLDIGGFMAANPLDPWGLLPFEQSGRFFSWDLEPFTGQPVRRLVGTYLEPTTLAPTLALALLFAMAAWERRRRGVDGHGAPPWFVGRAPWLALVFLVAGLLTVSKGFAVFVVLLLLWRLTGFPAPKQVFVMSTAGIALAWALGEAGYQEGAFSHFAGLASATEYLVQGNWFGEGLGAAGNYTASDHDVGTESGLGNGIAQVGLVALLPLLWVRAIALALTREARRRRDPGGEWIAAWLLLWFLTYLLSASSLGVGGNALGFAMLALYLHPAWNEPARPGVRR